MKKETQKIEKISAIRIYDKTYPAYQTMGAMLAFKANCGKDVSEMGSGDTSLITTYLYFVVRSACRREGVEFPFTEINDFADGISLDDFTAWSLSIAAPDAAAPDATDDAAGEASGEQE